jgi:predicted glycosyltransferase
MAIETFLVVQFSNGVGHLARCSAIARGLRAISHVTMFSGGPPVENYELPSGVDFIQLPAVRWARTADSIPVPVDPQYSAAEIDSLRSDRLVESYRLRKPKVVVIEYFPFAPKRFGATLDRLLEEIRNERVRPIVVCSIRAYPRTWETDVDAAWINEKLRKNFDCVLHHADPELFPLSSLGSYIEAALSGIPVTQTGFVRRPISRFAGNRPVNGLLLTVGGGGAIGANLLERWINCAKAGSRELFPINVVCGPLMDPENRKRLRAYENDDITVHDWVENIDQLMSASRAVVCLGGYNTLVEALSLNKAVLSFPNKVLGDQAFQAKALCSQGMLLMGDQSQSNTEVTALMDDLLRFRPRRQIDCNGTERSVEVISNLLRARRL